MKNIINTLKIKEHIIIIILFILIILLILFIPNLDNSFIKANKLYINEILVNNTYTHLDDDSEYSDYIEIYNGYKHDINLEGYHISDSEFETNKWTFPNIVIKSKEYLIIYASGKDKCNLKSKICHTNFKLSSEGEILTLTDKSNNIINKISYQKVPNDTAYGYYKGRYNYLDSPTPGYKNLSTLKKTKIDNYNIYINEYLTHNTNSIYIDNNYYDWIELYNDNDKSVELHNIYLSDDENELNKYKLPEIKIEAKSYYLIYLGDESKYLNNQVITNFKLSDTDSHLIISNGKHIIDKTELVILKDNISYGKKENKWYYFTKPTPGYENNTIPHSSLGGTS